MKLLKLIGVITIPILITFIVIGCITCLICIYQQKDLLEGWFQFPVVSLTIIIYIVSLNAVLKKLFL